MAFAHRFRPASQ